MKPLRYSQQNLTPEDEQAVLEALRSPYLTQGPKVEEFEQVLAEYVGSKHAVCVSNGTVALELAYKASRLDMILTSPLTFMATANAMQGNAQFQDVSSVTGNVEFVGTYGLTGAIVGIVPVHFAGRAAPIPKTIITNFVIEDACHALGAVDFDGCSKIGSCAHSLATVFSFHPVKPITTGEGGAITTNDESLAKELRSLRDHGREDGLMVRLGTNARMTELQAALGLSQLKRCDEMRDSRAILATIYSPLLTDVAGVDRPDWPTTRSAWHLYPIRIKNGRRDAVKAKLNAQGIGAQVHYNPIVPLHPYYRKRFGYKPGDFPNAEAWAAEELSLPLHAGMNESDVERVVKALREALL